MDNTGTGSPEPTSEAGPNEDQAGEIRQPNGDPSTKLLTSMETLLSRLFAMSQTSSTVSTSAPKLIQFDPDDAEADIDGWCDVTEIIVEKKCLEGVELLMALTRALKGRAATCLTKLNLKNLTWDAVKETLLAKFSKPKLIQDHFDEILRFQISAKETACEAAMRLWNMIERVPKTDLLEEVITGLVISVLCQKDNLIRRELTSHVITTRAQLFRILSSLSLKRRLDTAADGNQEPDPKRPRTSDIRFPGRCHRCGLSGHRQIDCRRRKEDSGSSKNQDHASSTRIQDKATVTCYTCGKSGHVSTACPDKKTGGGAVNKEVNLCDHHLSRSSLVASSGEQFPFLFDSGSSCSLLTESLCERFPGTVRNDLVFLTGIGGDNIQCSCQILSTVKIGDALVDINFHVVPQSVISVPIIIGRDILDKGYSVTIDDNKLVFHVKKLTNFCETELISLDISQVETDLEGEDKNMLLKILHKYSNYFIEGVPTRRVNTGQLVIKLIDPHKVVHRSPYRLAPVEKQIVREKIQQLLDAGIIRESSSPFASPILLVKKKDNSDRMCVDFRELNSNTRAEHYPLPRIEEQIDQLTGANFFSSLDMASGFHQIPIHPDSIEMTAFVTPEGQYEYLAMPFGLRNAPSIYQRCITKALHKLDNRPLIYMDDVLCYSSDILHGLQRLDETLHALTIAGFSLNLRKCKFMKVKINYLGYSLQSGEIRPNNHKIQALVDTPSPNTATQVRQFIGLASYFRKFIPSFTNVIGPLYPLTKLKGPIRWTDRHEEIRNKIVKILTSEPVLTIFDPELPVELHTDASAEGYGAILIQKKNNLPHVVEYYSRRTSEVESRYHSYELETLAVVRSVEHFRHYLYGRRFTVYTDCNSLKASKSKVDLTPRVHRWWAILQAYDFDIIYREGRGMEHADYFSRNLQLNTGASTSKTPVEKCVQFVELHQGWLSVEQKRDSEIQDLILKHINNDFPEAVRNTYDVRDGILFRKVERSKVTSWLPIVPRSLIWTLINHVHNELHHLGSDKTLDKLYELYWFPQMSKCVRKFIDSCIVCKASKGPSGAQPVRLHSIPKASVPWHTIHIDFTGKLSGKSDRKEYCSVIIDGFSKYVLLEHTLSLDATSAVQAIQKAVCLFGAPKRVIADQGRCYISTEFKNFCTDHKISLHFIATGSSRANGQVERIMRTLKSLLTIVENESNKTWRDELGNIQLALNSTKSTVTRYSPTELMFGIRAQSLGLSKISTRQSDDENNRLDLGSIRENALNNIQSAAIADTHRFNRGRSSIKPLSKGDFVFIKNSERNQTKLDRKFKGPFIITSVLENDRYELKSISGSNRVYKYSHENLRSVPKGHTGLLEITDSLLNEEEAETALADVSLSQNNLSDDTEIAIGDDLLRAASDTASADSETLTAGSDTISVYSDLETLNELCEAEIHNEQDCP